MIGDRSQESIAGGRGRRPSWARRLLLLLLAMIGVVLIVAAVTIGPLLLAPNRYEGVRSIERRTDYRDPRLMAAAWALPVARRYRARPFEYQANPSFCGPTSVANLLRSAGIAMTQSQAIDGTRHEPWFGVLIGGMTIDELADLLATRIGRPVGVVRGASLADFRVLMASANDPRRRMIVNFHRGPMFGRGHGHFSPLLGYLGNRDLVLVGDVNADYRLYLVQTERLWRAVRTIDDATGKERGVIVVRVPAPKPPRAAARPVPG